MHRSVRTTAAPFCVAVTVAAFAAPVAAEPAIPSGVWMKAGGKAAVELFACEDDQLCGRLIWAMPSEFPDGQTKDIRNPDASLQSRELCGATIIWGLDRDGAGKWRGGYVYDPSIGKTYGARMDQEAPDRIRVRGYKFVNLLGKTETWQPATPEVMAQLCTPPLTASQAAGAQATEAGSPPPQE